MDLLSREISINGSFLKSKLPAKLDAVNYLPGQLFSSYFAYLFLLISTNLSDAKTTFCRTSCLPLLCLLRHDADFHAPVLLPAGFGIVARYGLTFAVTDNGQP